MNQGITSITRLISSSWLGRMFYSASKNKPSSRKKHRVSSSVLLSALTIATGAAHSQQAVLIEDVNQLPIAAGGSPGQKIEYNGNIYFSATDGVYGDELYRYDGNTVSLAADINPGYGDSNPQKFTLFNDKLYFSAVTADAGYELHVYDGSSVSLVEDINSGTGSANPDKFVTYDDKLYFIANDGTSGSQLYLHDGVNTVQVSNICSSCSIEPFIEYDGFLYLSIDDGVTGTELYVTDGDNVSMVKDIRVGANDSNPTNFTVFNSKLYFTASGVTSNQDLYVLDDSGQPQMITINSTGGSGVDKLYEFNNNLYFSAQISAGDNPTGVELFVLNDDGTGASLVADIYPGANSGNPKNFTALNNKLYFSAFSAETGTEVYVYDGSTVSVAADIANGPASSNPVGFVAFNNSLYFNAVGPEGSELYVIDGDGATLVKDIFPGGSTNFWGLESPNGSNPNEFIVFNDELLFSANSELGFELYVFDGSDVSLLADIYRSTKDSFPEYLTLFNDKLYFVANDGVRGSELYEFDGTQNTLVADINPGEVGSNPRYLTVFNNTLYFSADDGVHGDELWRYDGTEVSLVADIHTVYSGDPENFTEFNNKLYFTASASGVGEELFVFDGNSVSIVEDLKTGPTGGSPYNLTVFNNKLYFVGSDDNTGRELFVLDNDGISLVKDIYPGFTTSQASNFTVFDDVLVFYAEDGQHGFELHVMDSDNNITLYDLRLGSGDSHPSHFTLYDDKLYFSAQHDGTYPKLHVFDGDNVNVVVDSQSNLPVYLPHELTVFDNKLYFVGDDADQNRHFYVYDGSRITVVEDIVGGDFGKGQEHVTIINNQLVFEASENYDKELYLFDGENPPTRIDVRKGSSSLPGDFIAYNDRVVFTASTAPTGKEVFQLVYADADGNLTAGSGSDTAELFTRNDSASSAVNLMDVRITDVGTSDGFSLDVSQLVVNVSGTASDAERNAVTWRLQGQGVSNVVGTYDATNDTVTFSHLKISIADSSSQTYTINAFFNDAANVTEGNTFILSVDGDSDLTASGSGFGNTTAVTHTVTIVDNTAPTANAQNVSTNEDTAKTITLSGSDIDVDDSLTYAIVSAPTNGTLTGTAPNLTYTPNSDFHGDDSFTFKANDGSVDSTPATVSIAVAPVADVPVLAAIANASTAEDAPFNLKVASSDADGDALTYRLKDGSPDWLSIAEINAYDVTTFAGSGNKGSDDLNGVYASFREPIGVAIDSDGNVLVADKGNQVVRKITPSRDVSTLAGAAGVYGDADGDALSEARFSEPQGIAVDSSGNIYVTDTSNQIIRKITPNGVVSTIAGAAYTEGDTNGDALSEARFDSPVGIAVDASGNVYIADEDNRLIRKITPAGVVSTLAGGGHDLDNHSDDGNGVQATFAYPKGVAVDASGTVYVADSSNNTIRKIAANADVTTLAGLSGFEGDGDGIGAQATFSRPNDVTVDSAGNLYVADTFNHIIRKITPAAEVTTIAGNSGQSGYANGSGEDVRFANPRGIAVDKEGNIYVGDTGNHAIRKLAFFSGIEISANPTNAEVGEHEVCVIVSDTSNNEAEQCFTLTVSNQNDAPTASNQNITTDEDKAKAIVLTGSDVDAGDSLTYAVVSSPMNGALTGTVPNLTYTPKANFTGDDSFTFKVSDSQGVDSQAGTISITVNPVNDAPKANAQTVNTLEDTPVNITFSGSDIDSSGLTYAIVTPPSNGKLMGTGATRSYVPNANFNGKDSVTFRASDAALTSSPAVVTINVSSVNDAPVAMDDTLTVDQNSINNQVNVLVNDSDIEGALTIVSASAAHGQVINQNGMSLSYTPKQDFIGADSVNYTVRDEDGATASAKVSIMVAKPADNQAPVANADSATVNAGESITIDVLANDTDAENDSLTLVSATAPVGQVEVIDNKVRFTAASNLSGLSVVNYLLRDDADNTAEGVLNVTINNAQGIVLNVPADKCDVNAVNATGLLTRVELGDAFATDIQGRELAVSLVDGNTLFAPGRHVVLWQTIDRSGNQKIAEQIICVNPQVNLGIDKSLVEGETVGIQVSLNGQAPSYPVTVTYSVAGTADAMDHNLESGVVTIVEGTSTTIEFDVEQDGVVESDETIVISLDASNHLGTNATQTFTITEQNVAPVIDLTAQQGDEVRTMVSVDGGEVVIRSGATDANASDTLSFAWQSGDDMLINTSINDDIFIFSPTDLEAGFYSVTLTVTDNGSPSLSDVETISIEVTDSLPTLTDKDTDGDGVPDELEGLSDSDGDGIADYLDGIDGCNVQQEQGAQSERFLVESPVGTCLRQGKFAMQGDSNGLLVTEGGVENVQTLPADSDVENIGGLFDYVVTDLAQTGDIVPIVIPQRSPIPENAVYRKYNDARGWHNFIENTTNSLWSAPGEQGQCPSPDITPHTNSITPWTQGLTPGHWCVQMLIEDGGLNDDDNMANGTVVDPGFVGAVQNGNNAPVAMDDVAELIINTDITVDILANDSDADNDDLVITSAVANIGKVEITDNRLHYTPPRNYSGTVTVIYGVNDGQGATTHAELTLTILDNTPPVVVSEQSQTNQGKSVTANLLENDSDGENDTLRLVAVDNQNVSFTSGGQATFTPPDDFFGSITINYTVEDIAGNQTQGQWAITVIQVHQPVASTSGGGSMGLLALIALLLLALRNVNASIRPRKGQRIPVLTMLLAALGFTSATSAAAEQSDWYLLAEAGVAKNDVNKLDMTRLLSQINEPSTLSVSALNIDDSDAAWSLHAGYRFHPNLSVELGYMDLGNRSVDVSGRTTDLNRFYRQVSEVYPEAGEGMSAALAATLPVFKDELSVTVRLGYFDWDGGYRTLSGQQGVASSRVEGEDVWYGVSANYAFNKQISGLVNFKRVNLNRDDNNVVSIGLAFHF